MKKLFEGLSAGDVATMVMLAAWFILGIFGVFYLQGLFLGFV